MLNMISSNQIQRELYQKYQQHGESKGQHREGIKRSQRDIPIVSYELNLRTWMNWISLNLVYMEPIVYKGNATVLKRKGIK